MLKATLLGRDISYTLSPAIHSAIADELGKQLSFTVTDVPYDRLNGSVEKLLCETDGFFVTKPYKNDVARLLGAEGSVNVVRSRDRECFNTDGAGFILALDKNFPGWRSEVNGVLILGAGGAAQALVRALIPLGKKVYVLNRTLMNALKLCKLGAELYSNQPAELAVNCTTLGMNGEDVLRALCVLPQFKYAFDLIYAAGITPFLRRSAAAGALTAGGLDMLVYQAIEGDRLLFFPDIDADKVFDGVKRRLGDRL